MKIFFSSSRWIKSARALSSLFEQFPEEIDLCTFIKVYSFLVGITLAGIHRRNSLFIGFFGVAKGLPFLFRSPNGVSKLPLCSGRTNHKVSKEGWNSLSLLTNAFYVVCVHSPRFKPVPRALMFSSGLAVSLALGLETLSLSSPCI